MDEALQVRYGNSSSAFLPIALGCILLLFASVLGVAVGASAFIFCLGFSMAALVWILPLNLAVLFFLAYLFLDGAIKILSNYHPVLHVAQDLLLLTILLRSVFDRKSHGFGKFSKTPHIALFGLFSIWIFIQYVNPFGIGLWPSIAGSKVYLTGMVFFFLCYHHLQPKDFNTILFWVVCLGLMQGTLACIEYIFFRDWCFKLHPKYVQLAGDRFVGDLFRPFGTTSSPGMPSVWIFLTAGPAAYLVVNANSMLRMAFAALHIFVSCFTLLFCQTRAAIAISLLNLAAVWLCPFRGIFKRMTIVILLILILVPFLLYSSNGVFTEISKSTDISMNEQDKSELIKKRALTTFDSKEVASARGGALTMSLKLLQIAPFGIGLSRVGAASAVWKERMDGEQYFGKDWAFVDNLYRAIFTELGVFGLISWLILVGTLTSTCLVESIKRGSKRLWFCSFYIIILLIAGFGSEGILYNPTTSFFWMILAMGIKEVKVGEEKL